MRWQAALALLWTAWSSAACTGPRCVPQDDDVSEDARAPSLFQQGAGTKTSAQETQTVSFFQQAVVRKHDLQARVTRGAGEPGALAEPASAARLRASGSGRQALQPTPLQSVAAYDGGGSQPKKQGAPSETTGQALRAEVAGAGGAWPLSSDGYWQTFWGKADFPDRFELAEDVKPRFPEGSDIWNVSLNWANVTVRHPTGVVSNLATREVKWANVNYMSLDTLYIVSLVAYPAVFIFLLLALTVLTGVCMAWLNSGEEAEGREEEQDQPIVSSAVGSSLALNSEGLSPIARRVFASWALFCRTIPAWMVFGTPSLLIALTRSYPQEVFMLLLVVSSVLVFSNGLYMVFFCPFMLQKMNRAMSGRDLGELPDSPPRSEEARCEDDVVHWIVLPNFQEDAETLRGSLLSAAQSPIARRQICVLLAMEDREPGAEQKAQKLKADFADSFCEVAISMHPSNLPNDPPGKASNMAWAFKELSRLVKELGQDPELVVLTVGDADSDFHRLYFQGLGRQFAETEPSRRSSKIWQAPIFHVKNYHRQPMLLIVGTMFTAMSEVAVLSDPNSIRFPYSTYSLSLQLVRRVGGWDAEWIAEDWHMGIKCFLLTFGESEVEPVLYPTVNYMPEVTGSWIGTVHARWSQAKRHALGFSDMSYYFMMLPLLFCRLSANQGRGQGGANLQDFWKMFFHGIAYIIRLVNTHVVVGIMTLYMIISILLKNVMYWELQDLRHIGQLFDRATAACGAFFMASLVSIAITTLSFQVVYAGLKDRMEPATKAWKYLFTCTIVHWAYTFVASAAFAAVYCTGLAAAVWIAAVKVLLQGSFEYEVAAKPTKEA